MVFCPCRRRQSTIEHGDVTEKYVLEELLGAGSVGTVRKAHSRTNPSERVAVKTVKFKDPEEGSVLGPIEVAKLLADVEILFRCRHPNLIRAREAFRCSTKLDVVMDLAFGGEVAVIFAHENFHSEVITRGIVTQVCAALQHLHSRDVVHRDVKSENVVYVDGQRKIVKLVDFGYASQGHGQTDQESEFQRRLLVGTVPYMAPESFRTPQVKDRPVDIWAMGIYTYLLLFGRTPFSPEGNSLGDFKDAICGPWYYPENQREDYSGDALSFLMQSLEKKPELRLTAMTATSHAWFGAEPDDVMETLLPHFYVWQKNLQHSIEARSTGLMDSASSSSSVQAIGSSDSAHEAAKEGQRANGEKAHGQESAWTESASDRVKYGSSNIWVPSTSLGTSLGIPEQNSARSRGSTANSVDLLLSRHGSQSELSSGPRSSLSSTSAMSDHSGLSLSSTASGLKARAALAAQLFGAGQGDEASEKDTMLTSADEEDYSEDGGDTSRKASIGNTGSGAGKAKAKAKGKKVAKPSGTKGDISGSKRSSQRPASPSKRDSQATGAGGKQDTGIKRVSQRPRGKKNQLPPLTKMLTAVAETVESSSPMSPLTGAVTRSKAAGGPLPATGEYQIVD